MPAKSSGLTANLRAEPRSRPEISREIKVWLLSMYAEDFASDHDDLESDDHVALPVGAAGFSR